MGPVHGGAQRLVPVSAAPPPAGKQPEPVVEILGDLDGGHGRDSSRRQLNRQRNAVQSTAHVGHRIPVCSSDRESIEQRPGSLDEQLHSLRVRGIGVHRRQAQSRDCEDAFALQSQPFATGRQEPHLRTDVKDARSDISSLVEQMLAIVQDHQSVLEPKRMCHRIRKTQSLLLPNSGGCCDCFSDALLVICRRQLTEPDTIGELGQHLGGNLERESRLAHAAHAGQGDQLAIVECSDDGRDELATPDETRPLHGQVGGIRAYRANRSELDSQTGCRELKQCFRSAQISHHMFTEADQLEPIELGDKIRGCLRNQDLLTVSRCHDPRGPIHDDSEIVPVPFLCSTGVHAHPHRKCQCSLRFNCTPGRRRSFSERNTKPIATRGKDVATEGFNCRAHDVVVPLERFLHRVGPLVPQPRRPLDVREQKRHRPRRPIPCHQQTLDDDGRYRKWVGHAHSVQTPRPCESHSAGEVQRASVQQVPIDGASANVAENRPFRRRSNVRDSGTRSWDG